MPRESLPSLPRTVHSGPAGAAETDNADEVFRFADLSAYPWKKRLLIRVADLAFYWLIRLIGRTVRLDVVDFHHWQRATIDGNEPILALWHNDIFLHTLFWQQRGMVVMTSQSLDGEYIARFIQRFGFGAARGSSTRGGVGAILEMIRQAKLGRPTGFTVDGPKGPRHLVKAGIVMLAKKSGRPIVPAVATPLRCWEVKNWDRLRIPRPLTSARFEVGTPIFVPPDADSASLEMYRLRVQSTLDELELRGQAWRRGEPISESAETLTRRAA